VWLESQLHEHGALAWEDLRNALQDHEAQELVLRLMSTTMGEQSLEESGLELRDLLNRMLMDHLKEQETLALEASKADPTATLRYRDLLARRLQLEQATRSKS
jgi:DNA primase